MGGLQLCSRVAQCRPRGIRSAWITSWGSKLTQRLEQRQDSIRCVVYDRFRATTRPCRVPPRCPLLQGCAVCVNFLVSCHLSFLQGAVAAGHGGGCAAGGQLRRLYPAVGARPASQQLPGGGPAPTAVLRPPHGRGAPPAPHTHPSLPPQHSPQVSEARACTWPGLAIWCAVRRLFDGCWFYRVAAGQTCQLGMRQTLRPAC